MAKCFNVSQRERRDALASRKRCLHGDPHTAKLKNRKQPISVSGKRKRKLLKKWRREQKEAIEKGLLTMEDVEMAAAADDDDDHQGTSKEASKTPKKIHLKKSVKIKANKKQKGKKNKSKSIPNVSSSDIMVE